jgi:hypothetical protein
LESTGKKSSKFPVGILLPHPAISGAFLQDPVISSLLFCRILQDPDAGIIDSGIIKCTLDMLFDNDVFIYIYTLNELTK